MLAPLHHVPGPVGGSLSRIQCVMTCPLPTIINYNSSAIEIDTLVVVAVVVVVELVLMCAVGTRQCPAAVPT